jgi:hypothetical protein
LIEIEIAKELGRLLRFPQALLVDPREENAGKRSYTAQGMILFFLAHAVFAAYAINAR